MTLWVRFEHFMRTFCASLSLTHFGKLHAYTIGSAKFYFYFIFTVHSSSDYYVRASINFFYLSPLSRDIWIGREWCVPLTFRRYVRTMPRMWNAWKCQSRSAWALELQPILFRDLLLTCRVSRHRPLNQFNSMLANAYERNACVCVKMFDNLQGHDSVFASVYVRPNQIEINLNSMHIQFWIKMYWFCCCWRLLVARVEDVCVLRKLHENKHHKLYINTTLYCMVMHVSTQWRRQSLSFCVWK